MSYTILNIIERNWMEKIKNIEFLRIIGCLAIILYHMFTKTGIAELINDIDIYTKFHNMTSNGDKAVDLFFIISGFFFIFKFNSAQSLWEFLKHKLIRLYPVVTFVVLVSFLLSLFGIYEFSFYGFTLDYLGINGTILTLKTGHIGGLWYVTTMLWTCILFGYIIKNYQKKNVDLFIALLIFFSYGFIIHALKGNIGCTTGTTINYIYNIGLLRAFGGIGIGYFIAQWYKVNFDKIKIFNPNLFQKLSITILEFMCIFFIINNLILHKLHYSNKIIFIVVFTIAIMLFLFKKGFITKLLDINFWQNMSKYTYSLYMTHIVTLRFFKFTLWKYHGDFVYNYPILNILLFLSATLLFGIFTYHFIEKPAKIYLSKKLEQK